MTYNKSPLVSVGMPIYNSGEKLVAAIESIINQSYLNLEIIISDNHSSDNTPHICESYSNKNSKIKFYRQKENIGAYENFQFVLNKASGKYFMWAADDDIRSHDFIYQNLMELEKSQSFVASTSPNRFLSENSDIVDFDLDLDLDSRILRLLDNIWASHGVFYSLLRRDVAVNFDFSKTFIGFDWAFNLHLLSCGRIKRVKQGFLYLGSDGGSKQSNSWIKMANSNVQKYIPLFDFTISACKIVKMKKTKSLLVFYFKLLRLNLTAIRSRYKLFIN